MKKTLTATAALLLSTGAAHAVGLDRSGQDITVIFEEGDYAELSFGSVMPDATGSDVVAFGGLDTGNVAEDYTRFSLAYKAQINDQLSAAVIFDQPYGANVTYPTNSGADGSIALGGTSAELNSTAVTGLLRYKLNENFSVHGGFRVQTLDANITLSGLAYGPANGYNVDLGKNSAVGYLAGVAYERPDIALRVALTYFTEVEHEFPTIDPAGSSTTDVTTPQAVNLNFQTGVAADTLVFGSIRWAEYSEVIVAPLGLGGSSLTDIEDGFTYTLGIGRQFTEQLSGSFTIGYDTEGEDDLVSPLSPTNGNYTFTIGGKYDINDNLAVSAGISYAVLGDARPQTADTARAEFEENSALGVGIQIGYSF